MNPDGSLNNNNANNTNGVVADRENVRSSKRRGVESKALTQGTSFPAARRKHATQRKAKTCYRMRYDASLFGSLAISSGGRSPKRSGCERR